MNQFVSNENILNTNENEEIFYLSFNIDQIELTGFELNMQNSQSR